VKPSMDHCNYEGKRDNWVRDLAQTHNSLYTEFYVMCSKAATLRRGL